MINDSKDIIHYTFFSYHNYGLKAITHGQLVAYSDIQLTKHIHVESIKFPTYTLNILPFHENATKIAEPLSFSFSPSGKELMRKQEKAPLLNFQAWLYKIEKEESLPKTQLEIIKKPTEDLIDIDQPENIIDLHIEKIDPNFDTLDRSQILHIQFNYFQKELEKVIALNYQSLIVIHGIGVNTLKDKIRKYLMGNKEVINYRDANVRDYGYGATEVFLKN